MRRYKYINNMAIGGLKKIQKSVRFRYFVYEYVMKFNGKNFSDKLENIIIEHARLTSAHEHDM